MYQCFDYPELDEGEIKALKALYNGEADASQQRLSLSVIVNKLSRSNDILFIPGNGDQTAFLNGRAFVGQKIQKYLKLSRFKGDKK